MARTITIRRTVTGPTNTFSSDFSVTGSAEVVLEETVPNTALLADPMEINLPIPNDSVALPLQAVVLGATGDIDSITFHSAAGAGAGAQVGTLNISAIEGSDTSYFWPAELNQAAPDTFSSDTDIARLDVYRPAGATGNITLYGLVIYDATFVSN